MKEGGVEGLLAMHSMGVWSRSGLKAMHSMGVWSRSGLIAMYSMEFGVGVV